MDISDMTASMQAYFARVKTKFAETLSAANNYTDSRIGNHNHDGRYYTKSQVAALLANTAQVRYLNQDQFEIKIDGVWRKVSIFKDGGTGGGET